MKYHQCREGSPKGIEIARNAYHLNMISIAMSAEWLRSWLQLEKAVEAMAVFYCFLAREARF